MDFPDRRLACFGSTKKWATLAPIIGKPINEDVIRQHWGDIMRLAASIRDGSLKPSAILRKLGACRQQNRLYLTLGEIGRIERTLFMLDWIENAALRMECQAGLNKGEARHSLAWAVFAHSQGRIHDRSEAAQQKRAMTLTLSSLPSRSGTPSTWARLQTISQKQAPCSIQHCCHLRPHTDGTTSFSQEILTGIPGPQSAKSPGHCISGQRETGEPDAKRKSSRVVPP